MQPGDIARQRFDLMLIGLLGMTPLGLVCRPFLGRGYGFVAHGTESWSEPRWTRRFAARRASFAFAVSNDTARALARATGIAPGIVRHLPNTLDPGFDAMPEATGVAPRQELLTVSRLSADEGMKGVDHAIRAGGILNEIIEDILKASDMNTQIASATEQQSAVIDSLSQNMDNINESFAQSSEGADAIALAGSHLNELAERMHQQLQQFRI